MTATAIARTTGNQRQIAHDESPVDADTKRAYDDAFARDSLGGQEPIADTLDPLDALIAAEEEADNYSYTPREPSYDESAPSLAEASMATTMTPMEMEVEALAAQYEDVQTARHDDELPNPGHNGGAGRGIGGNAHRPGRRRDR